MSARDDEDRRWRALADLIALGSPLTSEDADFVRVYESTHPECAAESRIWDELLDKLAGPQGETYESGDDEALVASIVANYRAQDRASAEAVDPPTKPDTKPARLHLRSRSRWPFVAVGGLAVAASLALFLLTQGLPEPGPEAPRQAFVEPPKVKPTTSRGASQAKVDTGADKLINIQDDALIALGTAGGITVEGQPLKVGERIANGLTMTVEDETCLVFHAPFASVCLRPGTIATLHQSATLRSFELERGALVATLDSLPEGQAFIVRAEGGQARAIGTVFLVQVTAEEPRGERVEVGVFSGEVKILAPGFEDAHSLGALEYANLGHPEQKNALPQKLEAWASARSDTADLWRQLERPSQLHLRPFRSSLRIDGHHLGQLPSGDVELLVEAGEHTIEISDERSAGHGVRSFVGDPTAPTTFGTDDLRANPKPSKSSPWYSKKSTPVPVQPPGPTIGELRQRASDARAKHAWRAAIDAYEELLELYPATPEAHNVQVQLGELLRRQGQPGRALRHFQAYLIRGGPLAAEARFGKVLALQQQGRSSEEAAAIAEFIRLHPHHIEADKLRQRALELEARTSP
ncbi:MAG TPA: hypothetical protein ENJ18_13865 [Nannocystis exedens]|nr:hypothetical protein [Nannocystis exedens]